MNSAHFPLTATLSAEDISRAFLVGDALVPALRGVSLAVQPGEMVALRGRSGAGKTTLLAILAGLDRPDAGEVTLAGERLGTLDESARAKLRRERVGLLFQQPHLFPLLTARENVEVALRMLQVGAHDRTTRAEEALSAVGLAARSHHRALELSGGEQQRVALARALVHRPSVLLADEPTGSLDSRTAREVAALLRATAHERGIAMLVATHDAIVVEAADRQLLIEDGHVRQAATAASSR